MLRNHINTGGCGLSRSSFLCLIVPPNWGKKRPTIEKTNSQKQRRAMLVLFNWPPSKKKQTHRAKRFYCSSCCWFVLRLDILETKQGRWLWWSNQQHTSLSVLPLCKTGPDACLRGFVPSAARCEAFLVLPTEGRAGGLSYRAEQSAECQGEWQVCFLFSA